MERERFSCCTIRSLERLIKSLKVLVLMFDLDWFSMKNYSKEKNLPVLSIYFKFPLGKMFKNYEIRMRSNNIDRI